MEKYMCEKFWRASSTNANVSATRYRATRNQQIVEFFDRAGRREADGISEHAIHVSFMQLPTLVPRYFGNQGGAIMRTLGKIAATLGVIGAIIAGSAVPAAAWYGYYHHRYYPHHYGYYHRHYYHRHYYAYYPYQYHHHHYRHHYWHRWY